MTHEEAVKKFIEELEKSSNWDDAFERVTNFMITIHGVRCDDCHTRVVASIALLVHGMEKAERRMSLCRFVRTLHRQIEEHERTKKLMQDLAQDIQDFFFKREDSDSSTMG